MNAQSFLTFILLMTTGLVWAYSGFRDHFSGVREYRQQVHELRQQVEREELKQALLLQQMEEFEQDVAQVLPEAMQRNGKGEKGYPLRNLASVVHKPSKGEVQESLVNALFLRGKDRFSKGQYQKSNQIFRKVINKYNFSVHVTESYFLLAEGYFQLRRFEECTKTVERMVELFPESELTGFALLRLGKIFEYQDRSDEAIEIYQTVLRSYPFRDVASQAVHSIRTVSP